MSCAPGLPQFSAVLLTKIDVRRRRPPHRARPNQEPAKKKQHRGEAKRATPEPVGRGGEGRGRGGRGYTTVTPKTPHNSAYISITRQSEPRPSKTIIMMPSTTQIGPPSSKTRIVAPSTRQSGPPPSETAIVAPRTTQSGPPPSWGGTSAVLRIDTVLQPCLLRETPCFGNTAVLPLRRKE